MELIKNKLCKNPEILTRIIDSNAVVIFLSDDYDSIGKREIYIFNETGTKIWGLVDDKNNIEDITQKISFEYDLTLQEVRKSIEKFVDRLADKKLIMIR